VTAIADKIGRNDLTADDQAEVDFWTAALEEHSNRAMLNISRQALAKLLGIIGKLRTEQRGPEIERARAVHDVVQLIREWWMTIRDCSCNGAGCIESDYAPGTFSPCCGCNPDWSRIPEPRAPQWDRTTPPANILAIVNAERRLSSSAPSPEDKGSERC
jgi:hypothetical protein